MNKLHAALRVLIVIAFTLGVYSLAQAQATRTWVSGVGDDVNPCSRTAPCKTFAGAISKTAANGEIDCIDPGGFGAVTITKGITIDGGGTFGSILGAGVSGAIIINDTAAPPTAVVTIRNISINGAGTGVDGIRILKAKTVHVENVEIFGFTGDGIEAAISQVATGGTVAYFDDVDIRSMSGAASVGFKLSSPGAFLAHFSNCRVQRVPTGIQAGNNSFIFVRNSEITESVLIGIELVNNAAGSPKSTIENTFLSSNVTGLSAGNGTTAFLSQTTITQCGTGIAAGGGTVQSSGNNRILGNSNDGLTPGIVNPK